MSDSGDVQRRLSAVDARLEVVAADAAAARHLAAASDRDFSDLAVKVDANRVAINALGVQTAARFDRLETRFDGLESRFDGLESEMRAGFAQTAAGMERIVELITRAGES